MKVSKSNSGVLSSGGAVVASDLDVDTTGISYDTSTDFVGIGTATPGVKLEVQDTTTSSANTGGALRLSANDGAPMGDSHRLGVIEFTGAEDSSNTQTVGARIEAITDAAWTNAENGCALYFYTTDANAVQTNVLKIDSNKKSTFTGNVQVNGDIDLTGALSFDGSGASISSIDTDLSSVAGTDTTLASAKAIKSYVDTAVAADVDLTSDVTGTLPVANGGTGASTLTDGGVLLGSGTGGVTATGVLTNGQLLIGDGSGDPTIAALTAGTGIDVTNGAGSITIATDVSDFLTNGSDNRIVTATGTDAMNAESALTFDGNTLTVTDAVTDTSAGTFTAVAIDFDKTGASISDNTMIGIDLDMDNTTATGGINSMTGLKVTPTCTHPSGSGTVNVKGMEVVATGSTSPETSTVRALDLTSTGGDYNQGIYCKVADGGPDLKMVSSADVGDYCTIAVGAAGATTITTNDDDGANADLSFSVDGSFDVTAATSVSFAADVTISGTTPQLTIGDGGEEDTLLVFDGHSGGADFRVGIDDGTDTLEIGKGSAHGTDAVIKVDSGANLVTLLNAAPADTKYSGTVVVLQAGEDLEIGEVVYLKPADGKVYKAVATAAATSRAIAMATVDVAADGYAAFLIEGFLRADTNFPTYSAGDVLYTPEAETSGKNCPENVAPDTAGDFVQIIGWARDGNTCYVNFNSTVIGL